MRNHLWSISVGALLLASTLNTGCTGAKETADEAEISASGASGNRPSGSDITAAEVASSGERSVEEILEGRASGVAVLRTSDGGFQLRIRGTSTFSGNNEPLIVIDGKALPDGYRGSIPVNPHDVESIKVLKNAIDLAFYGMRGANGVIEITTKRGRQ